MTDKWDFEGEPETEPRPHGDKPDRWNEELHRTDNGEARDILHNAAIILRKDHRFAGRLRWNQMLEAAEAERLPWRKGAGWQAWTDADDLQLANWCQQRHAYLKPRTVAAAVQVVARDRTHHPVRERLNALRWDGVPRLDSWLTTYLGVIPTDYTKAVGRAWMISAVARAFAPGCKVDHALILEGPQGVTKSTLAAVLALDPALFTDQVADLGTKDSSQDLRGKWIVELGELSAMQRSEVERVKSFISRAIDHYRPSYGTRSQDFPRQCVFIGTTNEDAYLHDATGNRRFWPVKVGTVDLAGLRQNVEQLWAEAVGAYRRGVKWWLDPEIEKQAREEQDKRRVSDPWEAAIVAWLQGRTTTTIAAVLEHAIAQPKERQDQRSQNRVARVLRAAKWERYRARENGVLAWAYRRGEP